MRIDLAKQGFKAPVDVQTRQRISIQCRAADGDPTGAVVEVRRAFAGEGNSPRVAFGTVQTLDVSGDTITTIDVTDTAWLHLVVTTAKAGASIDMEYELSGHVDGRAFTSRAYLDAPGVRGTVGASMSHKAFVLAAPMGAVTTGAVEIKGSIGSPGSGYKALSFSPAATLTLDGSTITEIAAGPVGVLSAVCTAAQIGLAVDLHWYTRGEALAEA